MLEHNVVDSKVLELDNMMMVVDSMVLGSNVVLVVNMDRSTDYLHCNSNLSRT
jgi:hypothetical protein